MSLELLMNVNYSVVLVQTHYSQKIFVGDIKPTAGDMTKWKVAKHLLHTIVGGIQI